MATTIAIQMTSQGLLIPRTALQEWEQIELEAVKSETGILIRPKNLPLQQEHVLDMQILEKMNLLLPVEPSPIPVSTISAERQTELSRKFSVGKPLSEIIVEEREDRI